MRKVLISLMIGSLFLLGGTANAARFARIASGTVGAGFYAAGTTLVSVLNAVQKDINYTSVTGGSIKNNIIVDKNEVEFGLSLTSTLDEAWNGVENFPAPLRNLRYVMAVYPQVSHIIVGPKINSISELRGKRVEFGPIGGGRDTNNRLTLAAYGIGMDEIKISRNSAAEIAELFKTGDVDGHVWLTAYPGAAVNDVLQNGGKLISVEKDKRDEIVKKYPFYVPWDIPKGTYEGYNEDIIGFSAFCVMLAHKDLDPELVYKTTKTLFENTKMLKERSGALFDFFGIKNSMAGRAIPLHPGAERYYKEVGLIK